MTPKRPGYAIVYLTLALTTLLFLLSKPSLADLGFNVFVTLAQISALLGAVLFSFSFILAARTYLIEEAFGGLDRAYRFHHKIGVWSFSFLLIHLTSVLVGYKILGVELLSVVFSQATFITGEVAIVLMAAIILTIIFARIKYQHFVIIQKFFAIPYAFGVYHLLIVPSDVSRYAPLRYFMVAVVALGGIAWIYREFLYRRLAPRAEYVVEKVIDKGANVTEVVLSPFDKPLKTRPGQFGYFSFHSENVSSEPHPFSFVSAPNALELRLAAKGLGDFTKSLPLLRPGERVTVFGPYGKFFSEYDPAGDNIFIAGGIGVTPFISALRGSAVCNKTKTFYTTRSETDNVFAPELAKYSCGPAAFEYFFHASDQRGMLTADIIEKRVKGLAGKKIYLCGPAGMMNALIKGFRAKGVPLKNIYFENFNYS